MCNCMEKKYGTGQARARPEPSAMDAFRAGPVKPRRSTYYYYYYYCYYYYYYYYYYDY